MKKTIERQKAEKYVMANGTCEKALEEINRFIDILGTQYPTGYDYATTRNYRSLIAIRTEIEKLKYINWKPSA